MATVVVNALGETCPAPVVKAVRALAGMNAAGVLEVHVDNEIAVQNLLRLAGKYALTMTQETRGEKHLVVKMIVENPMSIQAESVAAAEAAACNLGGTLVVAVDSDSMGRGSEELGKTLMKGFFYALGQHQRLPDAILFYNGGARLTCAGSDALEDLKDMAERGVEIFTCGACLNFYELTEQLAVGAITNMYSIVETLSAAGKVVKP